jgi:hypothetical protein
VSVLRANSSHGAAVRHQYPRPNSATPPHARTALRTRTNIGTVPYHVYMMKRSLVHHDEALSHSSSSTRLLVIMCIMKALSHT